MHESNSKFLHLNRAMQLSFCIGIFMLFMKVYAYLLTGSAAILSDAAESVVHVFAVGFATYSLKLSHKPADQDHTYGHDKIAFFSAGFEGAIIIVAAVYILFQSVNKIIHGVTIENLDQGTFFMVVAMVINGWLGFYLIRQGKKFHSFVLEADGKHILTDCLTSAGVICALGLTRLTGWVYADPVVALLVGLNILWTGVKLLHSAFNGLMDRTDLRIDQHLRNLLDKETEVLGIKYHRLRHRNSGNRLLIEVHLLFPCELSISKTHEWATEIEKRVESAFDKPTELVTHLEPIEGHDEIHACMLGREG